MSRVIFLDIDGVLNTMEFLIEQKNPFLMNPKLVGLLQEVVEQTQAVFVISSTWRKWNDWKEVIRNAFVQAGWAHPPIIGKTIVLNDETRGQEIAAWLIENSVEDFLIIDDDDDMLPEQLSHFIHCDASVGFTKKEADMILSRWM